MYTRSCPDVLKGELVCFVPSSCVASPLRNMAVKFQGVIGGHMYLGQTHTSTNLGPLLQLVSEGVFDLWQ